MKNDSQPILLIAIDLKCNEENIENWFYSFKLFTGSFLKSAALYNLLDK